MTRKQKFILWVASLAVLAAFCLIASGCSTTEQYRPAPNILAIEDHAQRAAGSTDPALPALLQAERDARHAYYQAIRDKVDEARWVQVKRELEAAVKAAADRLREDGL